MEPIKNNTITNTTPKVNQPANNVQINANAVDNKNTKNGDTITIFNREVKKSTAIIAGIAALGAIIGAIFTGRHFIMANKAKVPNVTPDKTPDTTFLDNVKYFFNKDNNLAENIKLKNGQALNPDGKPFEGTMKIKNSSGNFELEFDEYGNIIKSIKDGNVLKEYEYVKGDRSIGFKVIDHQNNIETSISNESAVYDKIIRKQSNGKLIEGKAIAVNKDGTVTTNTFEQCKSDPRLDVITHHEIKNLNDGKIIQTGSLDETRKDIDASGALIINKDNIEWAFKPYLGWNKANIRVDNNREFVIKTKQTLPNGIIKSYNPGVEIGHDKYEIKFPDGTKIGIKNTEFGQIYIVNKSTHSNVTGEFFSENSDRKLSEKEKQELFNVYKHLCPDKKIAKHYIALDLSTENQRVGKIVNTDTCLKEEGLRKMIDSSLVSYNQDLVEIFNELSKKYNLT